MSRTAWPLELRIAAAIRIDGDCWLWTHALTRDGYGRISVGDRSCLAHRVAYETLIGPIPHGLEPDHLCRHPACCNPAHLELVPHAVNVRRAFALKPPKTHCKRGHLFDQTNTYYHPNGTRKCRACLRQRWQQSHQTAA